ncbi:hypothetical protein ABBQ32_001083 [Trebouxia sp. C0010 RCD-2024]
MQLARQQLNSVYDMQSGFGTFANRPQPVAEATWSASTVHQRHYPRQWACLRCCQHTAEEAVAALHSNNWPLAQPEMLKQVIQQLHVTQQDMTFHAEMSVGIQVAARTSRWSADNFAYGSTPFHGWLSMFEHPAVRGYVAAAVSCSKQFQVWGSSIGWMVFYAALTYGLEAVGYELLRCHVDIAQGVAADFQVPHVSFHAQDMLQSDLRHTAILMLASFCWDKQLHTLALNKIQAELLRGSIVVDYTAALGKCMKQIATVKIPVSWNSQQNMYVYLKE